MRLRIRGPTGTHTITLDDEATLNDLYTTITELTELIIYDIKAGFPPKPLDITDFPSDTKLSDTGIRFNGEQLIVAPKDHPDITMAKHSASHSTSMTNPPPSATQSSQSKKTTSATIPYRSRPAPQPKSTAATAATTQPKSTAATTSTQLPSLARKANKVESDPPSIPIPSRGGRLILRVMPDDNSCLFRALSSCLLGNALDGMTELRSIVAQAIAGHPDVYSEAVLQRSPEAYATWIQDPNSWGGYVDIKAIAENFATEVVGIDVQSGLVTRYAEGSRMRCFVVYSGIHYDALAFVPDGLQSEETEFDTKQFAVDDDAILEAARELARVLKERGYFTDTAGFTVKCGECGWTGKGELAASSHAESTGHANFQEG
jgi:ubiquitin thioesterase OTU1